MNRNDKDISNKAMELFERLGTAQYAHKYPYQLSGGQCQRTAAVRALIDDPKVIFGDEPTAALDHKSACEVTELLSEYTENTMAVVVTHDESLLVNADTVLSVNEGTIIYCSPFIQKNNTFLK